MLISAIVLGSGCAKKQTYVGSDGKVTVSEKGGEAKTVEIESGSAKSTVSLEKKTITEKELGVPVYPGATVEVSGNYEGSQEGKQESMQQTMLTSSDGFEKVFAFYKSNLKNVQSSFNQDTPGGKMAMFSVKSGDKGDISIHILTDKEKNVTQIQVIRMHKPQK